MTHLYIEQNTGLTEEVNSSIISKLYELAISGDLDNTSDLKGRLHSVSAKKTHVTYLSNNFNDLYLSVDNQYLDFEDPDIETYMKRYIGTDEGVTMADIQAFVASGTTFGAAYTNTHTERRGLFTTSEAERSVIDSFDELILFNGLTKIDGGCISKSNITSITLPSSITRLYTWSFLSCSNLSSINLENVQYIGGQSFDSCALNGVFNLDSVIEIGDNNRGSSFNGCSNITEINIGSNFTGFVGTANLQGCTSLTRVTGLSNITSIPNYTFKGDISLVYVDIDWSKLTSIGYGVFHNCPLTSIGDLDLPNVTLINQEGFMHCTGITSVALGNNVTIEGSNTFRDCSGLTLVTFGNTPTLNGANIFLNCTSLQTITGLSGITSIPSGMFYGCNSLLSTDINWNNIVGIGELSLRGCSLPISWPKNTITFSEQGLYSFYGSAVVFPQNITISALSTTSSNNKNWLNNAFSGGTVTLYNVTLDSTIKCIGEGAFRDTHMLSISAPYVEYIGESCFNNTDVTEIVLPNLIGYALNSNLYAYFSKCTNLLKVVLGHVTSIPAPNTYADDRSWFYRCSNIETLDVGDSVTTISINNKGGIFAQGGNPSMREYIIRNTTVPTISGNIDDTYNYIIRCFGGSLVKIYVPDSAVNDYKSAQYWSTIQSNIYPLSDIEPTT